MNLKRRVWLFLGLLVSVILGVDLSVSYFKLKSELQAQSEFDARMVYGFMMATRRIYQNQFIESELPVNKKTVGFLPAHSFSRIAQDFPNWSDSGVIFNNVSDRPRNPANLADENELAAIAWFRSNPEATERMATVRDANGEKQMLYAAPIWIEASCLKCHGAPDDAPESIRDGYAEAYGYKVGDLRGLVSIKVPTRKLDQRFREVWGAQIIKSLIGYGVLLLAIGYLLERLVTRRIVSLQAGAQRIAEGDYSTRLPVQHQDEICRLAEAFNRMAEGVQSRELALGKLSQAVEQSPESIVITDLEGRIEYVNASFVAYSGYKQEEVIGQNPRLLQSGKTPPERYQSMWAALRDGKGWQGEFINQRKDGSEYVEFAIIAPIRQADGTITNYLAIKQDITEKKRIGRELDAHRNHLESLVDQRTVELNEARQRADEANRAKSSFLANMSHEIRTPLNAINGMAYLLRRGGLPPEQMNRLDKLEAAGKHLLETINAVLDLSKIEAGKLALEQTEFRLETVIDNVLTMGSVKAAEKNLQLSSNLPPMGTALVGDPTRLQQALLNFVGNAIKFTEAGQVNLQVQIVEVAGERVLLRFEVTDTGIGIDQATLRRLFHAFEQADASTTRHYGGSGLGLTISKKIAEAMGGNAGATSQPGQGSTFWLTAWFGRGSNLSVSTSALITDAEQGIRQRFSGCRILVVEDEPINREIALSLLEETGLQVDFAEDGIEALARLAAADYELILMDMQMPRMGGLEATRAIRRLPNGQRVKILAMTANAYANDRQDCLDAGMDDFLAKPIEPDAFFTLLLRHLAATGH